MTAPLTEERLNEISKLLAQGSSYAQGLIKYDDNFWAVELPALIAAARAHISAWRDIATAPRDGTKLLLAHATYVAIGWWSNIEKSWWGFEGQLFPTHYMELPTPPIQSREEAYESRPLTLAERLFLDEVLAAQPTEAIAEDCTCTIAGDPSCPIHSKPRPDAIEAQEGERNQADICRKHAALSRPSEDQWHFTKLVLEDAADELTRLSGEVERLDAWREQAQQWEAAWLEAQSQLAACREALEAITRLETYGGSNLVDAATLERAKIIARSALATIKET